MSTETKDPKEMTTEELEQLLATKKKKEAADREKAKKKYEKERDLTVMQLVNEANTLKEMLTNFKAKCHQLMDEQHTKLQEYGGIRSNSKGGFKLSDTDGTMSITRRRDTVPTWDERSAKAIELIKEFLGDTIKKRDLNLHDILMSFLERNQNGDLEYSRVMDLIRHEDKYDDPRWKEGLKLIKESFSNHLKGYGYEFKVKLDDGKWHNIPLNFSGL